MLLALTAVGVAAPAASPASATPADVAGGDLPRSSAAGTTSNPTQRRVVLLGLRQRGNLARFVRRVSNPSSSRYRQFVGTAEFRQRFSARARDRRRIVQFLRSQRGVSKVELNSTWTSVLAVTTEAAGRRIFCAQGATVPMRGLCVPRELRSAVSQISAGERYQLPGSSGSAAATEAEASSTNTGTPQGCKDALGTGGFTPNQLATAYGVDRLHDRGLKGRGVRVATLSSQPLIQPGLKVWGRCFDLPAPRVELVSMPSANPLTSVPSTETVLDIESLASIAPRLQSITPIFVPLDQNFSHSFALFMFGALDRSRQAGRLPHILSISDGVCEAAFSADQLQLGQRMLREAAALGVTALAASGDLGFLGCFTGEPGANFPNSSRFVTGVGGTELTLSPQNEISEQVVWSTYASAGADGVGSGGGPSGLWSRPSFQQAPGIGPELQSGKSTRLGPDLSAMAAFTPGIAIYAKGTEQPWGADGGTSAATPLTAAVIALVHEQERRAGRPALGSLPPLLYELARGPAYNSIFDDITEGTSSQTPGSPVGQTPAGGAAQPGYDLATGLGSLKATAFADAVAGQRPPAP